MGNHVDNVEVLVLGEITRDLIFEIIQFQVRRNQVEPMKMRLADDFTDTQQLGVVEMPVERIVLAEIDFWPIAEHHPRARLSVAFAPENPKAKDTKMRSEK